MKNKILVSLIFLSFFAGMQKSTDAQTYNWDFQEYFWLSPQLEITSCEFVPLATGDFLYVCGVSEPSTMRGYFLFLLLNSNYQILSQQMIGHCSTPASQSHYEVKDVIELSNGNFAIAGSIKKVCSGNCISDGAIILVVNPSLNYVSFDWYQDVRIWNSIKEIDDGFVMCGQSFNYQAIIARQENGNIILSEEIPPLEACNSEYLELVKINNDEFLATGSRWANDQDPILIAIEGSNILYSSVYEANTSTNETGKTITYLGDYAFIAGTKDDFPLALHIDRFSGNVLNSVIYDLNQTIWDLDVEAIRVNQNNDFYINGSSANGIFNPAGSTNGFIFGFGGMDLYNTFETRFYGEHWDEWFSDMNITNMGNALTGGYSTYQSPNHLWIVERFNSILMTCHSEINQPEPIDYPLEEVPIKTIQVQIGFQGIDYLTKKYPIQEEPFCDKVLSKSTVIEDPADEISVIGSQLRFDNIIENADYKIYSYTGELILSGNSTGNSVNVSNLPRGMYICVIRTSEETLTHKFVK